MNGTIDLNADLGEGCPFDADIMPLISSCNIACGGHAGDPDSMRTALQQARQYRVAAGAHPSYPDREGFGRRASDLPLAQLEAALRSQIETLKTIANEQETRLLHLKPHGALYHRAEADPPFADLIAALTTELLPGAALIGPPASALAEAGKSHGIRFLGEGFADRAYADTGRLVPRSEPGAVLETDQARTEQALSIARDQRVFCQTGTMISVPAKTICLHGDSPGALESARAIRATLTSAGFEICAPT